LQINVEDLKHHEHPLGEQVHRQKEQDRPLTVSRSFQLAIDELISMMICTCKASQTLCDPLQTSREQVAKSFFATYHKHGEAYC